MQVVMTISQGRVVWDGQNLNVKEGAGRFIKLPTFGHLYNGLSAVDASYLEKKFPYGKVPVHRQDSRQKDEL